MVRTMAANPAAVTCNMPWDITATWWGSLLDWVDESYQLSFSPSCVCLCALDSSQASATVIQALEGDSAQNVSSSTGETHMCSVKVEFIYIT